jgi:hypothetical protein
MISRRLLIGVGVLFAGALAARPRLMTWGTTEEDRAQRLPGDGLVPGERDTTTMATTINAPTAAIWPWLAQMGWDRGGWYSWDRLDHGGRPSAPEINPAWQDLREGDRLYTLSDERSWFDVAHVEPGRSLVLRASLDLKGRPFDPSGPRPRRYIDSRWEFFLDPRPDGTTRLLVRSGGTGAPRRLTGLMNHVFWRPAHVIMQVRQFHQIRRRAEGLAATLGARELRRKVAARLS